MECPPGVGGLGRLLRLGLDAAALLATLLAALVACVVQAEIAVVCVGDSNTVGKRAASEPCIKNRPAQGIFNTLIFLSLEFNYPVNSINSIIEFQKKIC